MLVSCAAYRRPCLVVKAPTFCCFKYAFFYFCACETDAQLEVEQIHSGHILRARDEAADDAVVLHDRVPGARKGLVAAGCRRLDAKAPARAGACCSR